MIAFFPRDIEMWRKDFTFGEIRIGMIRDRAGFHSMYEFFDWLKTCGVRFDDPKHPVTLTDYDHPIHGRVQAVVQWSLIGWVKVL